VTDILTATEREDAIDEIATYFTCSLSQATEFIDGSIFRLVAGATLRRASQLAEDERMTENTGHPEDLAFNQAIADVQRSIDEAVSVLDTKNARRMPLVKTAIPTPRDREGLVRVLCDSASATPQSDKAWDRLWSGTESGGVRRDYLALADSILSSGWLANCEAAAGAAAVRSAADDLEEWDKVGPDVGVHLWRLRSHAANLVSASAKTSDGENR
jgi:hypothetical protein